LDRPHIFLPFRFLFQDSSKIIELEKECEDSTDLIPKLEENIPKLQKFLLDEEKVLEEIKDNSKGGFLSSIM
jgi:structural maintenance of chromosome 4